MNGDEARRAFHRAAERATTKIGEHVLGEAQRLAPIEEGTLRASGELEVTRTVDAYTAEVSFNEVYAARQHEETEWRHPLGGQAKYLEQPVKAAVPLLERALELELKVAGLL
jgi:hypothetical protein